MLQDLNIGLALWLAAGGDGWLYQETSGNDGIQYQRVKYKSMARILLVGSGADEQCAGYGRHKTKFRNKRWSVVCYLLKCMCSIAIIEINCASLVYLFLLVHASWLGLHEEMKLDMQRIWKRNLGRDDRCISDNGKEVLKVLDCIKTLTWSLYNSNERVSANKISHSIILFLSG